jgi:hypothetical protein
MALTAAAILGGCGGSLSGPSLLRSNVGVTGINNHAPPVIVCTAAVHPLELGRRAPTSPTHQQLQVYVPSPGSQPAIVDVDVTGVSLARAVPGVLGTEPVTYNAAGQLVAVYYTAANVGAETVRLQEIADAFGIEISDQPRAQLSLETADPGCSAVDVSIDQSRHVAPTGSPLGPGQSLKGIATYLLPPAVNTPILAGQSIQLYWSELSGAARIDLGAVGGSPPGSA